MKKIVSLITATMLILLTGCSNADTQPVISEEIPLESESVSEEVPAEATGPKLTFIGHAAIQLTTSDGRTILIDPSISTYEYPDAVDFILVTHSHEDHKPYYAIKLKENGTKITYNEALVDGEYKRFEYDGIVIEAVPMGGNDGHPLGYGTGFIVTIDGISIYHAGDSSNVPELQALAEKEIDYALYPIDGQFNMDAVEATELANIIGATHNIPIHMSNAPGEDKSVNFTPEGRLVLQETETITLEK